MREIELFYLADCPYCRLARRAVEELKEENPARADIQIDWIEESARPELAEARDYYYVPAIFRNGEKLYEARPTHDYDTIKARIREALDLVLAG